MFKKYVFCLMLLPVLAWAKVQSIDSIVAIVNDDVITQNELDFRTKVVKEQMQEAKVPVPSDDLLKPQVLDRVIEQMLILQMAEKAGIRADDMELERAVQNIAHNNKTTVSGLRQMLEKDGVDYTQFLADLRKQITVSRTEQSFLSDKIKLSQEEVDYLYKQMSSAQSQNKQYRLGHILIALPKDPTSEQLTRAQTKANEAREMLLAPANDFFDVAIKYSDSKDVLNQADLGLRRQAELPTLFSEAVGNMHVGQVHEPIRSASGFHVIKLLEVKQDTAQSDTQVIQEYLARHILLRPNEVRDEAATKKLMEDIHARLAKGEDFDKLAKQYSDDPGSKQEGGSLGWAQARVYTPAFAKAIESLKVGELSQPVKSDFGWHVVRVDDKRSRDVSENVLKARIQEQLYQRKYNDALQNWYTQLRDEASVVMVQAEHRTEVR